MVCRPVDLHNRGGGLALNSEKMKSWCVAVLCLGLCSLASHAADESAVGTLPQVGARVDDVSVSGISSGAYMAGQFQVAHSKRVSGAAIIAGGPYGCATSAYSGFFFGAARSTVNLSKAVNGCMLNLYAIWGVPNISRLEQQARTLEQEKAIDPLADLQDDRVYLFTGQNDHTVVPAIVMAAGRFYARLGLAADNIKLVKTYPAGHAIVTEEQGAACEWSAEPYVVDCDYDQAGDVLAHIYGDLKPRAKSLSRRFVAFDQQAFTSDLASHGLSKTGWVYVPSGCAKAEGCRVHVSFHGCGQSHEQVKDAFYQGGGFARWADTNQIVVLFPQVAVTSTNRQACWDWWGYTGDAFLTRSAPQIKAVKRMLDHLTGQPETVAQ
jgi:hypothetical protein